jgi:hypothetical protein
VSDARAVAAPGSWRLLVPAGWITLSTDAGRRDQEVKRLLDRQFTGTARDELILKRVDIDRRLRAELAAAAEQGATQLHALLEPVGGLPVSATLLVSQLVVGMDEETDRRLATMLGGDEGVEEVDSVEVGGARGLRRRRRVEEPSGPEPDAPAIWHTHVDFVLEADPDHLLVLSFVTSTDPLAEELVAVFDGIAGTLHHGDAEIEWEPTRFSRG